MTTVSSENGHFRDPAELTEHDLYHESKKYDVCRQASADDDVMSAHSMKPKTGEKHNRKSSPDGNRKTEEEGVEEEDKVSEAGTYTIEADVDDVEEETARKNIDEIFGLCVENASVNRPVIATEESSNVVVGQDEVKRETVVTASYRTGRGGRGASLEVKAGSADTVEDLDTADQSEVRDTLALFYVCVVV